MHKQVTETANMVYAYLKEQGLTERQMAKVLEMVLVLSDDKVRS